GKIKCMTFIDSTHSIAAASDNGSIHVFRIDYMTGVNSPKYGKPVTIRETYLDAEYAVAMEHFDTGTESILLYATSKGNICGLDLRSMEVLWTFENPRSHGVITAMVTDKKYRWLLIGTSRGIFTLWDLRFRIQLRSWVHPTKSRISKLLLHPQAGSGRQRWWVIVAAGKNEVSIWDIEKVECKEVYTVRSGDEKISGITFKQYDGIHVHYESHPTYRSTNNSTSSSQTSTNSHGSSKSSQSGGKRSSKQSKQQHNGKNQLIFNQQLQLLVNHLDCITDLKIFELPYPMLISADRDGIVKVFL
ncbi:2266_t:CDS:2, partial [Acaulospora colombiana]